MKFYIHTTGCKANQWDSFVIEGRLQAAGLFPGPMAEADVIVVNACAVTEGAERDARRFIAGLGKRNASARIILTGCQGQAYPERTFGAHTVLGQSEKFEIADYLERDGRFVSTEKRFPLEEGGITALPRGKTRFFFKIQDGCDRFCSYCVVPFGRGRPRSRPMAEVMETLERLATWGVKEVVLTGIELSSYRDGTTNTDLKGLLRMIDAARTPPRVRLSSIDPLYVDDEFIEIVARSRKVARSLHIPLQSGSDRILREMGRDYTARYIADMVGRLTKAIDGIGIGMDVIVGFPTEGEEEFMSTCALIDALDVYYLHIFPFSAREGTRAAAMEGKVPPGVKKQRVSLLKKLDAEKRRRFYERFLGSDAWIIPEGKIYKGVYVRGYADNYLPVHLPAQKGIENNMIKVKIKEIQGELLIGEASQE